MFSERLLQLHLATLRTVACVGGVAMVLSGRVASGQAVEGATRSGRTLAVWAAVARDEPLKTRMGNTHDRDLYLAGMRARWMLLRGPSVELAYTADLLPAVVSTGMPVYSNKPIPADCKLIAPCGIPVTQMTQETVYGSGVVPIGLELGFGITRTLALLVRGSAGAVYFSRPVPDPGERRLNLIFDVGTAIEARLSSRLGVTAGYRLSHLSNAGAGPVNPGMNSRMLELGLSFWR